jgi:hypothetical protein
MGSKDRDDFKIQILLVNEVFPVHPNASVNIEEKLPYAGISCPQDSQVSRETKRLRNRFSEDIFFHNSSDRITLRRFLHELKNIQ